MRYRIFIPAATAMLFALAACTQNELADDNRLPEGEYPLVIRATGLSVEATPQAAPSTRATVDGNWQGVQTVALKVGDEVKEYTVKATDADEYKNATLSRENDPHYWTSRNDITVSAWWPYNSTEMPAVKVAADQSKLADFQKSDFISAIDQTVKFDTPTLNFTHRTARVTVELKPGTGFTSVAGATVRLTSLSAVNENPTVINTYHASGNSNEESGNTYEALTAPQTVAKCKPFIEVKLDGGTFYFRPTSNVVLEAGNRYKYTVKVNATGLTLEGCTIGGWNDVGGEDGDAEILDYYIQEDGSYIVYNANGLLKWNEAVQNDPSINCTLDTDINLTGKEWTPVGNIDQKYTGTFDGNNHTITGLTINQPKNQYVGMFGRLGTGGKVQNLTLENVNISSSIHVGGVVGQNDGTVSGCTVSGTVNGSNSVGGVVGRNEGTVSGCTASGTVSSNNFVGGVVGENIDGTVTACYHAMGEVTVSSNNFVGGVVGENIDGTVTACYHAMGEVSGSDNVGSVAGYNKNTITACYWSDNSETGIGVGSGEATKVNGTGKAAWSDAVDAMNSALKEAGSEWCYELTEDLPMLTKVKKEE